MAEQVEITNVGNNGVASEATLKLLLDAMEKMAKSAGIDPKTVKEKTKQLKEETKNWKEFHETVEEATDAVKENTDAVEKSTYSFSKLGNTLLSSVLAGVGALAGSAVGVTAELFRSQGAIADFAQHLPVVGRSFAGLGEYLDNSIEALRSLTSSGATFNNSLVMLRMSAAESHMALSDYTNMIRQNSERLATFGGTVTQGAMSTKRLFQQLGSTQVELMNMGLSVADINEALINYQYINRAGSRAQQRDTQAQATAAAEYIKQITTLAKLTGQDAKSMQEKMAAQQADIAFQMKLAKLRPEERDKVQQGLAEAMAMAGETGALYFKQQFLGMPPLTRATQLFVATMGESASAIERMQQEAMNTGVTLEQFRSGSVDRLADFVEGSAAAGQRLEDVLAAASGGLEGPAAEISEIFKQQGKDFSMYLDSNGAFLREKFEQDVRAAQNELDQRDKVTSAMNAFQNSINNVKTTILAQLIDSGVFETAGKAIEAFSLLVTKVFTPERIASIGEFFESLNNVLSTFIDNLNDPNFNIGSAVGTLIWDIGAAFKDAIFSGDLTKTITAAAVGMFLAAKVGLLQLVTKGIGSMLFGGGDSQRAGTRGPDASLGKTIGSLGSGIAGLGRGLGRGIQSTLVGIARGIAAFGSMDVAKGIAVLSGGIVAVSGSLTASAYAFKQFADVEWDDMYKAGAALLGIAAPIGILSPLIAKIPPQMLVGAGILSASIAAIAAGVSAGGYLLSLSLPSIADGLKSFDSVNGENLKQVGLGMLGLGTGLLALGASQLVDYVNRFIGWLFGAEDPTEGLKKYEELAGPLSVAGPALKQFSAAYLQALSTMNAVKFNDNINDTIEKLNSILSLDFRTTTYQNPPIIDHIDLLGKGLDVLNNTVLPSNTGLVELKQNLENLRTVAGLDENIAMFNSSLDFSTVDNYTSSIENLKTALEELNEVLAESNNSWTSERMSAGELLQDVGTANRATADKIETLNTTLLAILTTLRENNAIDSNIERNTRVAGMNLGRGIITR